MSDNDAYPTREEINAVFIRECEQLGYTVVDPGIIHLGSETDMGGLMHVRVQRASGGIENPLETAFAAMRRHFGLPVAPPSTCIQITLMPGLEYRRERT